MHVMRLCSWCSTKRRDQASGKRHLLPLTKTAGQCSKKTPAYAGSALGQTGFSRNRLRCCLHVQGAAFVRLLLQRLELEQRFRVASLASGAHLRPLQSKARADQRLCIAAALSGALLPACRLQGIAPPGGKGDGVHWLGAVSPAFISDERRTPYCLAEGALCGQYQWC